MKVGFTGTQDGMDTWQAQAVFDIVMSIENLDEIHHGCCVGADLQLDDMTAYLQNSSFVWGHPPENTSKMAECHCDGFYPPKPYLARNKAIVDMTDSLIAAPKGPEELRSGTWSTVRYARKLGRPITIVWPDGSTTAEHGTEGTK